MNPLSLKTAIVTGGTGAIGQAVARQLADKGYRVAITARNEVKAQTTVSGIIRETGNVEVSYLLADLSRKKDIEALASKWNQPLDLLVNNAAIAPRKREETPEGIEMQLAVNVLSYFWMIRAFTPFLKQAVNARVVNVASYWAGDLDIDDLECRRRRYDNDRIYRQSKQADRMLTVAFAEKLKEHGITVNACHPGDVNSTLSNSLGFGGHQSPDQGAETPVYVATEPELAGVTGKYFEKERQVPCSFANNKNLIGRLFEACENY